MISINRKGVALAIAIMGFAFATQAQAHFHAGTAADPLGDVNAAVAVGLTNSQTDVKSFTNPGPPPAPPLVPGQCPPGYVATYWMVAASTFPYGVTNSKSQKVWPYCFNAAAVSGTGLTTLVAQGFGVENNPIDPSVTPSTQILCPTASIYYPIPGHAACKVGLTGADTPIPATVPPAPATPPANICSTGAVMIWYYSSPSYVASATGLVLSTATPPVVGPKCMTEVQNGVDVFHTWQTAGYSWLPNRGP